MKILVLGVGQSLRRDDAAGLLAVRRWECEQPATAACVRVETSEAPGVGLLGLLDGMDAALIVDAVNGPEPAGRVMRIGPDELEAFSLEASSSHGWGVAETLRLSRTISAGPVKCQVTLIGITGADFTMGEGLSPEVEQALPKVVEIIEKEIEKLI